MVEPGVAAQVFEGPNRIGPYELIAKLAQGGMGTVYLARMGGPAGFNKLAVVKELKEELLGSARFAQLFLEEARLAARLTHANIVHTYGAGEYDGRLYIAMEYLDGQPWTAVRHRLRENHALPLHVQLKVLAESLAGLHYAHELREFNGTALNVVHCDMSPQNVFVTYDGQVKVVDFGVARAAHDGAPRKDSLFLGKVAYCAPEQAKGEPIDRRADIFAVGVMLWEAISGQRFAIGDDPASSLQSRAKGVEPRIREVVPGTPAPLASICDRALSLHPGDRFSTAAEFRSELMEFMLKNGKNLEDTQLGRLVSNAFEEERSHIHALIDSQLDSDRKTVRPVADVSGGNGSSPADCTLQADLSRLASVTRLSDEGTMSSAISASLVAISNSIATPLVPPPPEEVPPPKKKSNNKLVAIALLLATAAAGGVFMARSTQQPAAEASAEDAQGSAEAQHAPAVGDSENMQGASPPSAATAPKSAGAAAVSTLSLRIKASPDNAEIFLDGDKVGQNPFSASPAQDHGVHKLKVVASGYETEERALIFDRDIDLDLHLEKAAARSTPAAKPRRPQSRRKSVTAPALPAADTVDAADEKNEMPPAPAAAQAEPAPTSPGKRGKSKGAENEDRKGLQIYDEDPYQ